MPSSSDSHRSGGCGLRLRCQPSVGTAPVAGAILYQDRCGSAHPPIADIDLSPKDAETVARITGGSHIWTTCTGGDRPFHDEAKSWRQPTRPHLGSATDGATSAGHHSQCDASMIKSKGRDRAGRS